MASKQSSISITALGKIILIKSEYISNVTYFSIYKFLDNSKKQFAVVQWIVKGDKIVYDKVDENSFYTSDRKQIISIDDLKVDETYKVLWKSNKYNAKFIMKGKIFILRKNNLGICI